MDADAGEQFGKGEGLDEVVVGTGLQASDAVGDAIAGRENNNRHIGRGAQAAGDLDAINSGEHQIENDEIMSSLAGGGEALGPIVSDRHLKPLKDEATTQVVGDLLLVFDNKDTLLHAAIVTGRSRVRKRGKTMSKASIPSCYNEQQEGTVYEPIHHLGLAPHVAHKENVLIEIYHPEADRCLVAARMSGLVLAAAQGDGIPQTLAIGVDAAGVLLNADTLFIGASLTKLATALVILRLADVGALALDSELAEYLPDAAAAQPGVTLRRILSHSAGLPIDVRPDRVPYRPGLDWPMLAAACVAEPAVAAPGTLVQYGNHGYGLVAVLIEQICGTSFASALQDLVLGPLHIEGYLGVEPPRAPALLADVRGTNPPELAPFTSPFYRSLALPWAGLVTTATGFLSLVRAFAGHPAGFVSAHIVADARRSQTSGLPGGSGPPLWYADCAWGLGPDIYGAKQPHWSPPNAAPESFGHAGASGCIAWHDPASRVSYAIMGTRTAANGWLLRHAPALGAALLAGRIAGPAR